MFICAKPSRPLWGFLYGWTLFLVIQTGTIAAVAVGFARYTGVLIPWVSETNYLIAPIRFGGYAVSLSTAQFIGLVMIALLTFMNTRGLSLGKLVQNIFTTAKTGALIALILLGIIVGVKSGAGAANFSDFWTLRGGLQDVGERSDRSDRIRSLRRHLRGTDQFAFLRGRLEQHHVHRRGGEKSASQHSARRSPSAPFWLSDSICSPTWPIWLRFRSTRFRMRRATGSRRRPPT